MHPPSLFLKALARAASEVNLLNDRQGVQGGSSLFCITLVGKGDVLSLGMIQFSDRGEGLKPLDIWALGRWLPLGGLLFCPEIGGSRAAGAHTLLTMHTLLTIAGGIVNRVGAIVNRVCFVQ